MRFSNTMNWNWNIKISTRIDRVHTYWIVECFLVDVSYLRRWQPMLLHCSPPLFYWKKFTEIRYKFTLFIQKKKKKEKKKHVQNRLEIGRYNGKLQQYWSTFFDHIVVIVQLTERVEKETSKICQTHVMPRDFAYEIIAATLEAFFYFVWKVPCKKIRFEDLQMMKVKGVSFVILIFECQFIAPCTALWSIKNWKECFGVILNRQLVWFCFESVVFILPEVRQWIMGKYSHWVIG